MKKLRCKDYNKWIATNRKVQSLDQNESKLNSAIIVKSGDHAPGDDKIIKTAFSKNNVVTIKSKWNSNNYLITRACRRSTMVPM